jgi:hypothetical protein
MKAGGTRLHHMFFFRAKKLIGDIMAAKKNVQTFEKRRKEDKRRRKQEEKRERRFDKNKKPAADSEMQVTDSASESTPAEKDI